LPPATRETLGRLLSRTLPRLYLAANALAEEMRRVRTEDEEWIAAGDLSFDLTVILGGQMADDQGCRMFLMYPDGTWIEVTEDTPYVIVGESSYGKPVLDRAWRFKGRLEDALTIGLLAFDATQASAGDVGPPLDTVLCSDGEYAMRERRFSAEELAPHRLTRVSVNSRCGRDGYEFGRTGANGGEVVRAGSPP
jgi:putative proteasome-type protease